MRFIADRLPLILLAGVLVLYLAFPTRTFYWDGVLFALNIESVAQHRASAALLVHPNHLLYSAFGYFLYRAVTAFGFVLRAITVLQTANMLASVAAAAILYNLAKRITHSAETALFSLILFAFGATWWKFSTDADAYIVSILLLLLAIRFALQEEPRLAPAALCHFLAMLFHQLAIFTFIAIFTAILLKRRWSKQKRVLFCAAYAAGTGACVAIVYGICYSQADHSAYPTLARFVSSYASDSGFTRSAGQLLNSYLTSYSKLFLGGKVSLFREYLSIASASACLICAAALCYAVWRFGRPASEARPQIDRRALAVLIAWLAPYLIFLASWDPGSAFHKLFVWPAIVLLVGVYAASRRSPRAASWIAIAVAAWNFAAFIYPHSHASADPVLVFAQRLDRELPKSATVYYSAFSPDDWYLDYFAPGRTWIKLDTPQPAGSFCLETTALAAWNPPAPVTQSWWLVNAQHNIRLACFEARN
jgi:hypothetical protein